jgi:hypothetical protein
MSVRGLFIDICSIYWVRDCSITLAQLQQRYGENLVLLEQLFSTGIIKKPNRDGYIKIVFLDKQYDILSKERTNKQKAGRLGGLAKSSRAKAEGYQKASYKDKDKDKDKDNNNDNDKDNDKDKENDKITLGDKPPLSEPPKLPKNHKKVKPAKNPRPRNLVMDALGALEGDIYQIPNATWKKIGKALKTIREVAPDVTPEEINKRAENYQSHFKDAMLTSTALASHWARCEKPHELHKTLHPNAQRGIERFCSEDEGEVIL